MAKRLAEEQSIDKLSQREFVQMRWDNRYELAA